ncbi:MAG: hypothetical protein ACO31Z_04340 [Litorivicinaceae bacterium]
MEFTPTVLFALAAALGLGLVIGWFLRPARVVMTTPPDLDRERALNQAKQEALLERLQAHLSATESDLEAIQVRQTALLAELRGEPTQDAAAVSQEQPLSVQAPRDYADTRGQLGHS